MTATTTRTRAVTLVVLAVLGLGSFALVSVDDADLGSRAPGTSDSSQR